MVCKGKLCKEKCQTCNEVGLGCCGVPFMTEEEVARIMVKHTDLINNSNNIIVRFGKDIFCIVDPSTTKNGVVHLEDVMFLPCPFLDKETNLCKVYENRPKMCRDFGEDERLVCLVKDLEIEEIKDLKDYPEKLNELLKNYKEDIKKAYDYAQEYFPNPGRQIGATNDFKDFMTLPEYTGKKMRDLLKNNRENTIIYLIQNIIYGYLTDLLEQDPNKEKAETEYLSVRKKYKFFVEKVNGKKKITALPILHFYTDKTVLKPLATMYNRIYLKAFMFPDVILNTLTTRAQSAVKGSVEKISCFKEKEKELENDKDATILTYLLISALMFKSYKTDYKFKSKFWAGLTIKNEELMEIIKYLTKELKAKMGQEPKFDFTDFKEGFLACMIEANEKLFKALLKQK